MASLDANVNCDTRPVCKITNDNYSYILDVDGESIDFVGFCSAEYFYKHYHKLGYKMVAVNWTPPNTKGLPIEQTTFEPLILSTRLKHRSTVPLSFVVDALAENLAYTKELKACLHTRQLAGRVNEEMETHGHLAVMPVDYLNFFYPLKP